MSEEPEVGVISCTSEDISWADCAKPCPEEPTADFYAARVAELEAANAKLKAKLAKMTAIEIVNRLAAIREEHLSWQARLDACPNSLHRGGHGLHGLDCPQPCPFAGRWEDRE